MAHYLFNLVGGDAAPRPVLREQAVGFLRTGMWGSTQGARADFETGVVRITASEYETALAVAATRATSPG